MALFCVAIKRDLVTLLKIPFLCHVLVFSYEILSVHRIIIILLPESFSHQRQLIVFH